MTDVTRILSEVQNGDRGAAEQLLPIVYEELRRLASARLAKESPGLTLQTTALVHEAYLRLVQTEEDPCWNGRGHFFAAAAEAMRRILIEHARQRKSVKRGAGYRKQDLRSVQIAVNTDADRLLELSEALDDYAAQDPVGAELVKLRYFVGLTVADAAELLGISRATADRTWAHARAWLYRRLAD